MPSTLTVTAGAGGWVVAELTGVAAATVNADSSQRLAFSVLSAATLTATARAGYRFAGWTLSGGLSACAGGLAGNPCALPAGSATADATVSAAFEAVPSTLTVVAGDQRLGGRRAHWRRRGDGQRGFLAKTRLQRPVRGDADGHRVRRLGLRRLDVP